MKRGDPLTMHQEHMRELHATFRKKGSYHNQKAFLELKDVYWLVHEFFTAFLERSYNFTEEELAREMRDFKHEFFSVPEETVLRWHAFLSKLSHSQYSGVQLDQPALHALLDEFNVLVDDTLGKAYTPPDEFTKHVQQAYIYLKNDDAPHAEEIYRKIMQSYETLSVEKRKEHYEQLQQLYKAIADARSAAAAIPR